MTEEGHQPPAKIQAQRPTTQPGSGIPPENIDAEIRSELFSGPIPHPAILGGYEQVCPGAADRIIAMAEKEQAHAHAVEVERLRNASETTRRGQNGAMAIGGIATAGSVLAVWAGSAAVGGIIATVGLGTLAVGFLGPQIAKIFRAKKADQLSDGKDSKRDDDGLDPGED